MSLRGQDEGYAMAVLLVAMTVAAIMMAAAMPVWKQMARREKEEELIFRGQQYARALRLFGQKYANAAPPNLDVLVEQRFLRKKFKDPITNDDFQPLLAGQPLPGAGTAPQTGRGQSGRGLSAGSGLQAPGAGGPQVPGVGGSQPAGGQPPPGGQAPGGRGSTIAAGPLSQGSGQASGRGSAFGPVGGATFGVTAGIVGVTSKSKDKSIRLYNGRDHYNEWAFVATQQVQAPGGTAAPGGVPGTAVPGQRGGQRGGRGQPPQPGTSPFGPGPGRGRGFGPSPFQPAQPIQPGRGRGGA